MSLATVEALLRAVAQWPHLDRQSFGPATTGKIYDTTRGRLVHSNVSQLRVLAFANDDYLVLNKPFDIAIDGTAKTRSRRPVTLAMLLLAIQPTVRQPPFFCHQLDYCTSGCIAIATSSQAARHAGKAFAGRRVQKRYIALVYGHIDAFPVGEEFLLQGTLVDTVGRVRMALLDETTPPKLRQTAKIATTCACLLSHEYLDSVAVTRLALVPKTGRRHQLRAHCALVLRHAIVGDFTYAPTLAESAKRTYLHAERLAIPDIRGAFDVTIPAPF